MAGSTASPESIPFVTGSDLDPIPSTFTPVIAQAIHDRLRKRQRYDFDWPDSAARIAQTGMEQGSLGYQRNTKSDYIYDNNQWVLKLPYIEFNSGLVGLGDGNNNGMGNLTVSAPGSTSTTMALSSGADGKVTVIDPGIYAITFFMNMGTESVGYTKFGFSDVTSGGDGSGGIIAVSSIPPGEVNMFVTNPIVRLTTANTVIKFWISKRTGGAANITAQTHIARIG